ncbi:MAG: chemotaxis protein CheA [Marinobacter sp.]
MSIDLEQFHGVFFEESAEHIDTMEQLLMTLDLEEPDPEQINSIFRAAHSIKGGSGTFGFKALTEVTHVMENLLDQIRRNERVLTRPLVDLLLEVLDTLRELVASYRAGDDVDDAAVADSIRSLEAVLAEPATNAPFAGTIAAATTEEDDAAFGFFEPLPADPENETEIEDSASAAYGFFGELPGSIQADNNAGAVAAIKSLSVKPAKSQAAAEASTIRVDTDKVDALINLVGELVITQSMLKVLGSDLHNVDELKMSTVLSELERNTREIQDSVMSIRMIPVSLVFNRFPRVVRDLAGKMGKDVNLVLAGTQTELDKGLIEKLVDPLTHLVRNSIDHGIEMPEVRKANGKPPRGEIKISASQQGGNILISISDDGAGLSRKNIVSKARQNGLVVHDDAPDSEVWDLIFQPGFSTAEVVTDVSGRGVGMDVVRRNIQQLGGRVEIHSILSVGSTFTIRLPLTLAIVDGMGVAVGGQTFIIPLVSIIESMQPPRKNIKQLAGSSLLHVREEFWPLLPLHQVMNITPKYQKPEEGIVVLIETSKKRYGLIVDELVGQQQVVIKSLEQHYRRVPGTAGATIMGDGSVAMILDVESLADIVPVPEGEPA